MNMDVASFLAEDIKNSDITSEALLSEEKARAIIIAKQDCVIAGLEEAIEIFSYLGLDVKTDTGDGIKTSKGDVILMIEGRAKDILAGERLALNFLGRMSGIATETRKLVDKCNKINLDLKIAATRKTTPGFREFEKKAVVLGGGEPHRYCLDDAFLIKDNHLKLLPSIEEAVLRAKKSEYAQKGKKVEIEVENLDDAIRAVKAEADIVMLDNMSSKDAKEAYLKIKDANRDVIVEISGGVTPDNIEEYAEHADMISLGYLTHSIKAMDFSLEITEVLGKSS
jgi:nicotinate-nucleotide pyrophosphorylase (carboxylating)